MSPLFTMKKYWGNIWKFQENYLSLQCQNSYFDYPGDIPAKGQVFLDTALEQDNTDTTPLKKATFRRLFLFFISFLEQPIIGWVHG